MSEPKPYSMAEEWQVLRQHLRDSDGGPLSEVQLKEMEKAFKCGFAIAFHILSYEITKYRDAIALDLVEKLDREIKKWEAEIDSAAKFWAKRN